MTNPPINPNNPVGTAIGAADTRAFGRRLADLVAPGDVAVTS